MRPFAYLSNYVQVAVQQAILADAPNHFDVTDVPLLQILDAIESSSGDALCGAHWLAIADRYATNDLQPNLSDSIGNHLKRITGISEPAAKIATPMWLAQLVKIVAGLRADPHRFPMPKLQETDAVVNKPIPTFASPSDVVESLSAPDPSRRLRACFRLLADTSLAKAHKDRLRTAIESEPLSLIRAVAQRALAKVSE